MTYRTANVPIDHEHVVRVVASDVAQHNFRDDADLPRHTLNMLALPA